MPAWLYVPTVYTTSPEDNAALRKQRCAEKSAPPVQSLNAASTSGVLLARRAAMRQRLAGALRRA